MHIPFRLQTLVATMGLAGAALLGQAHAADSIKIAMVIPATGPLTQYGDMVKEGVATAVEQINAAGASMAKKSKPPWSMMLANPSKAPWPPTEW